MQTQQIIEMAIKSGFEMDIFDGQAAVYFPEWFKKMKEFSKLVAKAKAEELATELEKGPLNDTATSIAIWIRSQE